MNKNLTMFFISLNLITACHFMEKREKSQLKQQVSLVSPVFSFSKIPPGKFVMGSPENEENMGRQDDEGQVSVEITRPFEMTVTEVTQSEWHSVMGDNPSFFKRPEDCHDHVIKDGEAMCPNHPWRYSMGLRGCKGSPYVQKGCYRLPTEAEWEWAARAGTKTAFFFGNDAKRGFGKLCLVF